MGKPWDARSIFFILSGKRGRMHPELDQEACSSCGNCVEICPGEVYQWIGERPEAVDVEECTECGACEEQCPVHAVTMVDD